MPVWKLLEQSIATEGLPTYSTREWANKFFFSFFFFFFTSENYEQNALNINTCRRIINLYCTEQPFATQLWCQPLRRQMGGICVFHTYYTYKLIQLCKWSSNIYKNIWLEKMGCSHGRKCKQFYFVLKRRRHTCTQLHDHF